MLIERCPRRDSDEMPPTGTLNLFMLIERCPRRDSNEMPLAGTLNLDEENNYENAPGGRQSIGIKYFTSNP